MTPMTLFLVSAWAAFLMWAAGEAVLCARDANGTGSTRARAVWTLGAAALSIHVALAFHGVHGWSHAAAVSATARQLQQTVGFAWGGGVVINYLLLGWWWINVTVSWLRPDLWNRPGFARSLRRSVFLFLWFNGAVVFAAGGRRWIGAFVCLGLLGLWWHRRPRTALNATGLNPL